MVSFFRFSFIISSMNGERGHFETTGRELQFGRWVNRNGIKRFLLDLDDTICVTRPIFRGAMKEATEIIAAHSSIMTQEQWMEVLDRIDGGLFEVYGVNANRWNITIETLAKKYGLYRHIQKKAKQILQNIYTTPLKMLDGAEEGLDFIKRVGVPMG